MVVVPQERIRRFTDAGWWGDLTLVDLFARHVAQRPHEEAVADAPNRAEFAHGSPRRLSWAQLDDEVTRFARVLIAEGIGRD